MPESRFPNTPATAEQGQGGLQDDRRENAIDSQNLAIAPTDGTSQRYNLDHHPFRAGLMLSLPKNEGVQWRCA